jgi:hypothetical protein
VFAIVNAHLARLYDTQGRYAEAEPREPLFAGEAVGWVMRASP